MGVSNNDLSAWYYVGEMGKLVWREKCMRSIADLRLSFALSRKASFWVRQGAYIFWEE